MLRAEKTERSYEGGAAVGMSLAGAVADAELGDAGQLIQNERD